MSSVKVFAKKDRWLARHTQLITQILMLLISEKKKSLNIHILTPHPPPIPFPIILYLSICQPKQTLSPPLSLLPTPETNILTSTIIATNSSTAATTTGGSIVVTTRGCVKARMLVVIAAMTVHLLYHKAVLWGLVWLTSTPRPAHPSASTATAIPWIPGEVMEATACHGWTGGGLGLPDDRGGGQGLHFILPSWKQNKVFIMCAFLFTKLKLCFYNLGKANSYSLCSWWCMWTNFMTHYAIRLTSFQDHPFHYILHIFSFTALRNPAQTDLSLQCGNNVESSTPPSLQCRITNFLLPFTVEPCTTLFLHCGIMYTFSFSTLWNHAYCGTTHTSFITLKNHDHLLLHFTVKLNSALCLLTK